MPPAQVTAMRPHVSVPTEEQPEFLRAALYLLCEDTDFLRKHASLLDYQDWSGGHIRWLINAALNHIDKYDRAPGIAAMRMRCEAEGDCTDEQRAHLRDFLAELSATSVDARTREYVADQFWGYASANVVKRALREAEAAARDGRFDHVQSIMREARRIIRRDEDNWLRLPEDAARFFDTFSSEHLATISIPTGIEPLDRALAGGIRPGELGVCHAPLGFGKSMFLVQAGAQAVRSGRKVMHLTFENSAEETTGRYMRNLLDLSEKELTGLSPEHEVYKTRLSAVFAAGGRLSLRCLTGSDTKPSDVAAFISGLPEADRPTLVVLDYGDLMASDEARWRSLPRSQEQGLVFAELRDLASDLNIAIWTATQANREALEKGRAKLENMANNIDKARVADIIVSLNRTDESRPVFVGASAEEVERAPQRLTLSLDKLRRGRDGLQWQVNARFDRANFHGEDSVDDDLF